MPRKPWWLLELLVSPSFYDQLLVINARVVLKASRLEVDKEMETWGSGVYRKGTLLMSG